MMMLGLAAAQSYTPPAEFLAAAAEQFEALLPEFTVQVSRVLPRLMWTGRSAGRLCGSQTCVLTCSLRTLC